MARQTGLVKFQGSLGDLVGYTRDGKPFLRKAPRRNPNTTTSVAKKNSNTVFGASSKAGKAVRMTLSPLANFIDGNFGNRLNAKFAQGMNFDRTDSTDHQPVLFSQHRALFKRMETNGATSWSSVCQVRYSLMHTKGRNKTTLVFQESDASAIKVPVGATHFCWIQLVGLVSDFYFDLKKKEYSPVNESLNTKNVVTRSQYISVNEPIPKTILTSVISERVVPEDVTVIQAVAIQFYEKGGNKYYPLQGNSSMCLLDVF